MLSLLTGATPYASIASTVLRLFRRLVSFQADISPLLAWSDVVERAAASTLSSKLQVHISLRFWSRITEIAASKLELMASISISLMRSGMVSELYVSSLAEKMSGSLYYEGGMKRHTLSATKQPQPQSSALRKRERVREFLPVLTPISSL